MYFICQFLLKNALILALLSAPVFSWSLGSRGRRQSASPVLPTPKLLPRATIVNISDPFWLHCNATGNPTPRTRLYFNHYVFTDVTREFPNGTFYISRAHLRHNGLWYCQSFNSSGVSQRSRFATVFVKAPAKVSKIVVIPGRNVSKGTVVTIKCPGFGNIPLWYQWFENGRKMNFLPDMNDINYPLNNSAKIECRVSNRFGSDAKSVDVFVYDADPLSTSTTSVTTITTTRPPPQIKCQPYSGTVCSKFLPLRHHWAYDPIEVRTMDIEKQEETARIILRKLDKARFSTYKDETRQCARGLKALVCGHIFPVCVNKTASEPGAGRTRAGSLCWEHCEAVRLLFCQHVSAKQMLKSLQEVGLSGSLLRWFPPNIETNDMCKRLPRAITPQASLNGIATSRVGSSSRQPQCTRVDFESEWRTVDSKSGKTNLCFNDRGLFYNGTVHLARSTSGAPLECASWNDTKVTPFLRRKGYSITAFPSLKTAGRSCRNPAGLQKRPFCVPQNPTKRQESVIVTCDLMSCVELHEKKYKDTPSTVNILGFVFQKEKVVLAVVLLIIGFVLIVFIISYCVFYQQRSSKSYKVTRKSDRMDGADKIHDSITAIGSSVGGASFNSDYGSVEAKRLLQTPNQDYHGKALNEFVSPQLQKLEYPRADIRSIKELGHGAFGEVYLVETPNLGNDSNNMPKRAAMKVLKNDCSADTQIQFLREATLLAELDHKNIVPLLGISLVYKPFCMLMEFMFHGDLNSFLRRYDPHKLGPVNLHPAAPAMNRHSTYENGHLGRTPSRIYVPAIHLDRENLCRMAVEISEGMIYLSHLNYVHRDLATRNCLLDEYLTVKIADFGLCRYIRRGEDFIDDDNGAMPIRWMPLESILERRFNLDTDVWSFGVLLWELFSFALQPYYGKTHEEVIEFLQKGSYLDKPPDAPDNVYRLMLRCWSRQRGERPTFAWLMRQLSELLRRWQENSPS